MTHDARWFLIYLLFAYSSLKSPSVTKLPVLYALFGESQMWITNYSGLQGSKSLSWDQESNRLMV